jgi:hypothetical protein
MKNKQPQDLKTEVLLAVKSSPVPLTPSMILAAVNRAGIDGISAGAIEQVAHSLTQGGELVESIGPDGRAYQSVLHADMRRIYAPFD